MENVATGGVKTGESGKLGKSLISKIIVMDGVKVGKVGKPQNSKIDERRKDQNEEKLCKSTIKGSRKTQS